MTNKIIEPFIIFLIVTSVVAITTKLIGGRYEQFIAGILLTILFYIIRLDYNSYDK